MKIRTVFTVGAAAVVAILVLVVMDKAGVDLPNPFDNGHDGDEVAHGSIRVEGQTPLTATDSLVIKVGEGEATVSIKAHQNWDRPGNVTDGDFQSTNGTASVRDPDQHDQPAELTIGVEYCAEGAITRTVSRDESGEQGPPEGDQVVLDMGSLFVCDAEWMPTEENEAAFGQDDTPADFQGQFEEVVKEAALAAVAASECPERLVESYTSQDFLDFVARALAERDGIPIDNVQIVPGHQGTTDAATQDDLRGTLDRFARNDDLRIDAFSGAGTAIEDSCFIDTRGEPLGSLDDIASPDPRAL